MPLVSKTILLLCALSLSNLNSAMGQTQTINNYDETIVTLLDAETQLTELGIDYLSHQQDLDRTIFLNTKVPALIEETMNVKEIDVSEAPRAQRQILSTAFASQPAQC